MKKITLLWMFLCLLNKAQAQKDATGCAYTDALLIKGLMNTNDIAAVENILRYYFPDTVVSVREQLSDQNEHQKILKAFLGNPTKYMGGLPVATSQGGASVPGAGDAINALGTFIANRFKQEINIAFLSKFRDDLKKDTLIGLLLPLSNAVMQQSDPYNYTSYMETLQEAFDSDLNSLPANLSKAIAWNKVTFKKPGTKYVVLVSLDAANTLLKNPSDPLKALTKLYQNPYLDSIQASERNLLLGLNFTVNALRVKNNNQVFLNSSDLRNLQRNDSLFHIYCALLIKQNEKIFALSGTSGLVASLNSLMGMTEQFNQQYTDLKNAYATNKISPDQVVSWYKYFVGCGRSLCIFAQTNLQVPGSAIVLESLNKMDTVGIIANYVLTKRYGLATLFTIELLQSTVSHIPSQLSIYLTFAANMLQAKSADDMVAVLDNAAMPVGSYRVKRNCSFDVSLNAYAGGFLGYNLKNDDALYGFTSPVGLYAGFGNLFLHKTGAAQKGDDGKSLGFFFPVVDVGAVTSFRLSNGNSQMAEINWSNVFAPGAYLTFGAGKCPVSFNVGGQYGPQLRSVDATGKTVLFDKEWYWRVAVLIDIPIFDFYTKQHALKLTQ